MSPRPHRTQLWRSDADGLWYVREVAGNGEVLTSSEGHVRHIDAYEIARSLDCGEPEQLDHDPNATQPGG